MEEIKEIRSREQSYPYILKELDKFTKSKESLSPSILYLKGDINLLEELSMKKNGIAVIGSRKISNEAEANAKDFFDKFLISKDWIIVSGLALGSDTIGHKMALDNGMKTVAIISVGLNYIYPKENTELSQEIIDNGGAILSELPPDFYPNRYEFSKYLVLRDRLQAGLSSCIYVLEANVESGTWHTVSWALKMNKPVFMNKTTYSNLIKMLNSNSLAKKYKFNIEIKTKISNLISDVEETDLESFISKIKSKQMSL